ncbi:bifunctional proline dehydrogenase/L-glutamate gamma-semialdehyde dehydrogenase [Rhodococcus chondri]|uniref:L-glutamate gamma-semialdehyde dehydrogenase n=1 Tax=Rhodococcus chondri TaxID=3065941 RepID=A0ABU7JSE4_9NOCA|nr:bifunctional proline dehydrogenase/L-glutamate gamma-semialdehyde dehydrogenase [Rhodococcus sp. CC-R104]MEE2032755.1 bifunctional proline dehydrogenase/L-glutamate gamma-semialdehyde dehydrogenase [Rhodococcus sp. CC-R104]
MSDSAHAPDHFTDTLADDAISLVRRWLSESASVAPDRAAAQLAGVLKDPHGLDFTVRFIDGVIRPEDRAVAAHNLAELSGDIPDFLPPPLRAAIRLGGRLGPTLPRIVVPAARRALRSMVGHLVVDAGDAQLGRAIGRVRRGDVRLNLNLLGEAVLGEREAVRRFDGTRVLLARDDVDYVSIKVSAAVAPHSPWAFDEAVDDIVERLTPLYELAAHSPTPKFVNLDMEEYHDLDLTVTAFTRILDNPALLQLSAGIVVQAYLPDALAALMRLQDWSASRRARGGADIKVRVVKGANLPMERVEASLRGWPLATWNTKQQTDTHYKRLLHYAFDRARIDNVRIGVAGHNLFDIAYAWLLADRRGVLDGVDFEMLLGMAQAQAEVVRRHVGGLLLYTPVVHPEEFDVAISYLVRRLEEGAGRDNFMSAVFELHRDEALFEREKQRFLASVTGLDDTIPSPARTQNRQIPPEVQPGNEFRNTPDTDPSLPQNRIWGRRILEHVPESRLGADIVAAHRVSDEPQLDAILTTAAAAGREWGTRSGAARAEVLDRVAHVLECRRADLCEVMAAEAGKTLDQADPEVSEAVDFAHFYADRARELDRIYGARFLPSALTVVTPPWNFPVAIPAGSTLAALASGAAVVIKPAALAARCGSVLVDAMWEAGVPREALQLVHLDEKPLGRQLVSDPRVDRVVLTGSYETAELFRSFRPDLRLMAETSGKNAIVVTPSADPDLAVRDILMSAFGHAGQKCSAASLVILVGSVATSRRFRDQLVDAVTSLQVGPPEDPRSRMGPLIEPAHGKLLDALTTLEAGQSWLVAPRRLDDDGRLWTPGVRTGVRRGSAAHLVEFFGPVLAIMTARDLDEAIDIQNEVEYGLTAGLQSLDAEEIGRWLDRVRAGNLYVNRGITGAIVRRQPFGGWKKSSVGAGFKAGGPNYLLGFGSWKPVPHSAVDERVDGVPERLLAAAEDLPDADLESLRRAFASDARAWRTEFGVARDVSGLTAERNLFRYRPARVHVRLGDNGRPTDLVRVLGAAARAGAPVDVSTATTLSDGLRSVLSDCASHVSVEDEAAWHSRVAAEPPARIRLIGGDFRALAEHLGRRCDLAVHDHPVTESGRIELLPFVLEQSISITAHRFGTPDHLTDEVI